MNILNWHLSIYLNESGLTQKVLSERSGVSYGSIRRFESTGKISLTSLLKISNAIGLLEEFNTLFNKPIIKNIRRDLFNRD